MKVTTIALVALLANAQGQGIRLRKANQAFTSTDAKIFAGTDASQAPADSQGEAPQIGSLLLSPLCAEFREEAGMADPADLLLNVKPEEATKFFCSPVGRTLLKLRVDSYMEAEDGANPCAMDLKALIEENAALFEAVETEKSACEEEISKEIEALNGPPSISYVEEEESSGGWVLFVLVIIMASDERLKEDIHYVGKSPSGIPVYTFKYRKDMERFLDGKVDTTSTYFGTMAQDLLNLAPDAVIVDPVDGYYRVDYSKIDVKPMKLV